jgi:pimeloyl-ACP methyl ester carboxylesterase
MHELHVRGEIKTLAFKEGSSGIFTGSLEGLYQGYRFGSTVPDERHHVLELPNGAIALTVKQEIRSRLGPRPAEHPFAGGKDPFAHLPVSTGGPPPGVAGMGGPPPGMADQGAPPEGTAVSGPPASTAAGGPHAGLAHGRPFYMEVHLRVDSEKSTGIFAGATGEAEIATPNYKMAGHLVINTKDGDLRLTFLEAGERGVLKANLSVDGENSTGIYRNARGELQFALTATPPNFGRGPYYGTIWLEHEPPAHLRSTAVMPMATRTTTARSAAPMERAEVNGVVLEYEVRGEGEAVVLLHGGLLADENTPLARESALTDRYRVINYHRRGFAGSAHPEGRATIADQAADCRALLEHLGVERAHVVGHSLGGVIGVQLALDAPDLVRSLALMEPALMGAIAKVEAANNPQAAASQQQFRAGMIQVQRIYETGDKRAALEAFLQTRAGDSFRVVLDWLLQTGEFEQAVADADTFLQVEMPAAFAWTFSPEEAKRIHQPVLSILGAHSPERAQRVHEVLQRWVPQTETLVLPNADHALPLMDPPGIAAAIADWLARNPSRAGA